MAIEARSDPKERAQLKLPELNFLCDAARAAGEIALRYYDGSAKVWTKPGNSPVTEADLAIDRMLHNELRTAFPGFGWVSEEIEDDGSRLTADASFIVDPIDGTRGFIQRSDDWVISIATVMHGEPMQGVLFNPTQGELFFAGPGVPGSLEAADGQISRLQPTFPKTLSDTVIAHSGPATLLPTMKKAPKVASLALRLARVAQGIFDGCLVRPNAQDWDIAAADALLRSCDLAVTSLDGTLPLYNRTSMTHGALVAGPPKVREHLASLVRKNK
ncbi:MAG: 3'(2'),5'-bisphosphate nucleotidase CysQ [Pseudomonadota bacterium]